MLNEQVIDKVIERLTNRIDEANTYTLERIGQSIKKIGTLSPSKAQQLGQILKYGGDYEKIVNKLSQITELNTKDIYEIFDEVAQNDYHFAKQFYDYRGMQYIPYENNYALQSQVKSIATITANTYANFSNTSTVALGTLDEYGTLTYHSLKDTYNNLIDEAILNVSQGKETFDEAMYRQLKTIGENGLKVVYPSVYETTDENGNTVLKNRTMRLDSAIRMNMKEGLRDLHYETQKRFGEEFGADGYEITVHSNPAPDHAEVQGRQFSKEEYLKLQTMGTAKDYNGKTVDMWNGKSFRPIRKHNCYHYEFPIILGVNKPEYSNEELQQIIDDNNEGFEIDGRHYTKYQGTQLQRALERRIRELKDQQIIGRASDNNKLISESQQKITQLTNKYRELSKVSGLPTKMQRMRVPGYRRMSVNNKINNYKEIEYARKNNSIWHSTESLRNIINDNKITSPSLAVGKEINTKVKYGTQLIEFKPEILENVNKSTVLYKGDGGNQFSKNKEHFSSLMKMLKNQPENYNELKFNKDIDFLKYIKKVYIREDEPVEIINLLKENKIKYQKYKDKRFR